MKYSARICYDAIPIKELKEIHENIRSVLMDNGADEYGDCIIDEICEVVGVPPTYVYYTEGE